MSRRSDKLGYATGLLVFWLAGCWAFAAAGNVGAPGLRFERNLGQAPEAVRYLARTGNHTIFLLGAGEVVLRLAEVAGRAGGGPGVLRMRLAGADPAATVEGVERLAGKSNYLLGSEPGRWQRDVPSYAKVRYHEVYPGIDLLLHARGGWLESDFLLRPGTEPGAIVLEFSGAEGIRIAPSGDLVLGPAEGEVRLLAPRLYQEVEGRQRTVTGGYELRGPARVGFWVGQYDATRPLVIDPVVRYASYIGGIGSEMGEAIAVDAAGHAYIVGWTTSPDFPTVTGGLQTAPAGGPDIFVSKLSPDGASVLFSTYIGGSGEDVARGVVLDSEGAIHIVGQTYSSDFPTTNDAVQKTLAGASSDAFVLTLSASGDQLLYSTFLGGSEREDGRAIAIRKDRYAYVVGNTTSADFPCTKGAYQCAYAGGEGDVFVTKLDLVGPAVVYSTYLGGSGADGREQGLPFNTPGHVRVTVDKRGSAYVMGDTESTDFPVTADALQPAYGGGDRDVFVAKLSPSGGGLDYATYLGGADLDFTGGIAVDDAGNTYLGGTTKSLNFPTEVPLQPVFGGARDGFLAKLAADGKSLVYSTYLGQENGDSIRYIALDSLGQVYASGGWKSLAFLTGEVSPLANPQYDAFFAKLDQSGQSVMHSIRFGGDASDGWWGLAINEFTDVYVVGFSKSENFPATDGAYQVASGGSPDGIVVHFTLPQSQLESEAAMGDVLPIILHYLLE